MKKPILSAVVFGLLPLLAACGDNHDGQYLPLATDQVYEYAIETIHGDNSSRQKSIIEITGPFQLDEESVYIRNRGAFFQDVLTRKDDGVYLIGDMRTADITRYDNDSLLLPVQPETGQTWTGYISSELLQWRKHALEHADKSLQQRFRIEYRIVSANETVTTPAGTYSNVLKVTGSGSHTFELGAVKDQTRITIKQTRWYAPGVGLVKSEREETSESGLLVAGKRVRELTAIY